jgi:hypothetical protein
MIGYLLFNNEAVINSNAKRVPCISITARSKEKLTVAARLTLKQRAAM